MVTVKLPLMLKMFENTTEIFGGGGGGRAGVGKTIGSPSGLPVQVKAGTTTPGWKLGVQGMGSLDHLVPLPLVHVTN